MGFLPLLRTLDELVYELMSWLVFYPVTLWRTLRHPLRMMDYADRELGDAPEEQYTDTLSPPLFLLVTLLISHAIELAVAGQSELVRSGSGLSALVTDDTSLVLLRLIVFSAFPMLMTVRLIRAQRGDLTRGSLKLPFYSQSYAAAPFALVLGLGATLLDAHWSWGTPVGAALMTAALVVYWLVQARWFAHHLNASFLRGFGHASFAMVQGVALVLVVAPLFA